MSDKIKTTKPADLSPQQAPELAAEAPVLGQGAGAPVAQLTALSGDVSAPEGVAATETPEPKHVDLSSGAGGCYTMIDGKRVRVSE